MTWTAPTSRWVASGVPALIATASLFAAPVSPPKYQEMALRTLAQLVEINSVEPSGSLDSVTAIAGRLRAAGFTDSELTILAPAEHPEKANLVVRLRGKGEGKPVLWTAHLDVVAADPGNWSVPPFKLTDSDGWLYGRGTGDMKGEAAALAVALIRLKAEQFVLRHDLIVAFTADEEAAGHANGVKWLLNTHRSMLDAGIALNPDAGGGGMRHGKHVFYNVETAEKTYATYTLAVINKGGHSSLPEPDNAIYRLSGALLKLSAYRFPARLTATTRAFLGAEAALEPEPIQRDIRALLATPSDPATADRLSTRLDLNALIRTTCVATLLEAGSAENALPQQANATIQCRLLPGDRPETVMQILHDVIDDAQVTVALARSVNESPETVPDSHVIDTVTRVVDSMWPHVPVLINMEAGGSDAIFTRAAGIPTYGVAAIFAQVNDNRHHGRDERISKTAFYEGVEFTYRLMKEVASKP